MYQMSFLHFPDTGISPSLRLELKNQCGWATSGQECLRKFCYLHARKFSLAVDSEHFRSSWSSVTAWPNSGGRRIVSDISDQIFVQLLLVPSHGSRILNSRSFYDGLLRAQKPFSQKQSNFRTQDSKSRREKKKRQKSSYEHFVQLPWKTIYRNRIETFMVL